MSDWTIYFNPRCGSCRKALELLKEHNIEPTVIEYLKTPPSASEIDDILKKLGMAPEFLVRTDEPIYEELGLATKKLNRDQWLQVIADNPILMKRPIVIHNNRAVIARHSSKANALFDLL